MGRTTRERRVPRWIASILATICLAVGSPLLALAGGIVAGPAAVAATPPPSLAGEFLLADNLFTFSAVHCDPSGDSTFTFHIAGAATGPYPGTFVVDGVVTVGPAVSSGITEGLPFPQGPTTSLTESFSITSGDITISGTKQAVADNATNDPSGGTCWQFQHTDFVPEPLDASGHIYRARARSSYSATLQTPDGAFSDHGGSIAQVQDFVENGYFPSLGGGGQLAKGGYFEQFLTSSGVSPLGPDAIGLTPPDATNPVSTSHTVTATVTSGGGAFPGSVVSFAVTGSDHTTGSCTTDAAGQCSFSYVGPDLPGADLITACTQGATGQICNTATKAWILPVATAGQTTGGGQIYNAAHTDKIAFGFTAKSDSHGIKGSCEVVDPSAGIKVHCSDVTNLTQGASHTTFFGDATVNGVATTYRIDVNDYAEPGAGSDTFKLVTASGYTASGVLTGGNIQVH